MFDLFRREGAFQVIADHKSRAVAVGEQNEPPFRPDLPQQRQGLPVLKNPKARRL